MAPKRQVTPAMTAFVRRGDRLALDVRCVTFMGGAAHGNTGDRDCHQKPSLYLASHDATTFCWTRGAGSLGCDTVASSAPKTTARHISTLTGKMGAQCWVSHLIFYF